MYSYRVLTVLPTSHQNINYITIFCAQVKHYKNMTDRANSSIREHESSQFQVSERFSGIRNSTKFTIHER